jgi:phage antirepressor YoqD-like protein
MVIDAVQELKKTSKDLIEFMELFLKADVATFKKSMAKMKKVMDAQKIEAEQAILKKQYIDVCSIQGESISFKDLAKLLDTKEDDLEEWVIEAMSNDVIDAKIDQVNEKVIIKTSKMRNMHKEEWTVIINKIQEWKKRFHRIEQILQVQPETQ